MLPKIRIISENASNEENHACEMFSNVFQELSISPSAVNSFKVTNLCKNGIYIHKIWRDTQFLGSGFDRILFHPQIS